MITKFYKGRLGIVEALGLPIRVITILYNLAVKELETDAGKDRLKAEALGEAMGGN